MAYEILPFTDEEKSRLSSFEAGILEQIGSRSDQNVAGRDRYNPEQDCWGDIEQRYCHNGRIEFGSLWQVHRIEVEDKELVYAHRPRTLYKVDEVFKLLSRVAGEQEPQDSTDPLESSTEFYINEFNKHGLAARTHFSQHNDILFKSRVTKFRACHGFGLNELSRPVGKKETEALLLVVQNPEENVIALNGLLALTKKERRTIKQAHTNYEKREKEHREKLEAIEKARRSAWATMMTDPTRY